MIAIICEGEIIVMIIHISKDNNYLCFCFDQEDQISTVIEDL